MELQVGSREALYQIMLARYYSSSLGRFMAVDPSGKSATPSNPQTWNRYTYSLNNPVNYVDPDGQDAQLAKGMSRADKSRLVTAIAKAARNPEFKHKLLNINASTQTVTYGTGTLRNDIKANPGTTSGTVQVGETLPSPAPATPTTPTGATVTIDFGNVDFSKNTDKPKSDVETVAHETGHAENMTNGVPASQVEEDAAKDLGKDVDADPNTKAEPTGKEKREIKKILKPNK